MNIDVLEKFRIGNGGIGDALIFLSTFYDEIEEANIIFLANDPVLMEELFSLFPKIKKKLILQNNWDYLREFYNHPNCIGTGILPKNLDYSKWKDVDIFKEYGVKEFPEFIKMFTPRKVVLSQKQLFVQSQGSAVEGEGKKRQLQEKALKQVALYQDAIEWWVCVSPEKFKPLSETFSLIRGSDLVISVDSFAKTVSAMSRIRTIVYDSVYRPEYLAGMSGEDWGHYVFLYPWSFIELRKQ